MARDRKKAKQRQRRQRRTGSRAAVAQRRDGDHGAAEVDAGAPDRAAPEPDLGPPSPLEHASAEVELAEAAERGGRSAEEPDDREGQEVFEDELEPVPGGGGNRGGGGRDAVEGFEGASPERSRSGGSRFVNFLRACVAELRRVQWPNRRQVTQATGVVMGFVIIAGAYLGLLDLIWSRVVNAIL